MTLPQSLQDREIGKEIEIRARGALEVKLWKRIAAMNPCEPDRRRQRPKKAGRNRIKPEAERQSVLAKELAKFDAENK